MRKRNIERMTIVEQLIAIREEVCSYMCKYKESVEMEYEDPVIQKAVLQGYCHNCPIVDIHYEDLDGKNRD